MRNVIYITLLLFLYTQGAHADGDISFSDLYKKYEEAIEKGEAEILENGVIAFFNDKIDFEEEQRKLDLKVSVRENFLSSNDIYICADEDITGYTPLPRADGAEQTSLKAGTKITVLEDDFIVIDKGYTVLEYAKITYEEKDYWGVNSIKEGDSTTNYLTTFGDCPKIQNRLVEAKFQEELDAEVSSEIIYLDGIPVTMGNQTVGVQYVCITDPFLNAYPNKDFSENKKLARGAEVQILQDNDSEPFTADRGGKAYEFVRVTSEGEAYWVARDFIKPYGDCKSIHKEPSNVCTQGGTMNFRDENIMGASIGTFDLGDLVYKRLGDIYSHKIAVLNSIERKFVPVSLTQESEDIVWVLDSAVNYSECAALSSGVLVTRQCRGFDPVRDSSGRIKSVRNRQFSYEMNTSDEFPLASRSIGSYFTGPARFYHSRGSRRHAAVDLYTRVRDYRGRNKGEYFSAINDGTIIALNSFYCGTFEMTVRAKNGTIWRYGEIRNPVSRNTPSSLRFRVGQGISKGDRLGQTLHVGNCAASYPPMLHLEKYKGSRFGALTVLAGRIFKRRYDLENPSCHVQRLEQKKFGASYANPN